MGKWYLVRHAATAWNAEGRVQGHCDPPLSERGRAQAERLAARLAAANFAAAYSSDLTRALDTANRVLEGRSIPLQKTPDLRELAYGEWETLTYKEVQARFPKEYADLMTGSIRFASPGGESVTQVIARMTRLRDRVAAAHSPGEDLLLIGHSGSIKGLLVSLLGLPPTAFWRFRLVPASVSIVTLHNPGATLDCWNDASHLEGLDAAG